MASDAYPAAVSLFPVLVEDEYPIASRYLEESTFGDKYALGRLAQLQVDVIGLSAPDILGTIAFEYEVGTETSFAHFGIDLPYFQAEGRALAFEGSRQSVHYPVNVVFVYHGFNLEVGQVVDLSHHLPGGNVLPQFHIEQSQFAVNRGTHLQLVLALADEQYILAHVLQVLFHLVHLDGAVDGVLHEAFADEAVLFLCHLIVFLCLKVFLTTDKAFVVQAFVLAEGAELAACIYVELHLFGLIVQLVLLHGHLGVAQEVLFLRQFRFGVQYLQVEVRVAQAQDDVAFLHMRAFLHYLFLHDASFFGAELHDGNGLHLSVQADIVVEFAVSDIGDVQRIAVDAQGGGMVAEDNPHQQNQDNGSPGNVRDVFLLDAFFLFKLNVHIFF